MIRLFVPTASFFKDQDILLSESQSHYVHKVMRLDVGEELLVFNGQDGEWLSRIVGVSKKQISLKVISQTRLPKTEGNTWLLFSPLKPKYQLFLEEKATELGAGCLWPVRCERTNVSHVNMRKMEAHVCEAAEQSGRLTVPCLKPLTSLSEVLETWPQDRLLLFGDETRTSPSLLQLSLPSTPVALLIGPEGGFSLQELDALRAHPHTQGVSLSPHTLRAETAALVGLAYLELMQLGKADEDGDSSPLA